VGGGLHVSGLLADRGAFDAAAGVIVGAVFFAVSLAGVVLEACE
jgi:hypothetical protein